MSHWEKWDIPTDRAIEEVAVWWHIFSEEVRYGKDSETRWPDLSEAERIALRSIAAKMLEHGILRVGPHLHWSYENEQKSFEAQCGGKA